MAQPRVASAVWFSAAMGLLDDAIREHMELKRLRGADPGEVAREEHDVLGPVPRGDEAASPSHGAGVAISEEIVPEDAGLEEHDSPITPQPADDPDFANIGQETAELDMRTVLGGGPALPAPDLL